MPSANRRESEVLMDPAQREWKTLEVEREGSLLRVWLNRPERLNALNGTALQEDCRVLRGTANGL